NTRSYVPDVLAGKDISTTFLDRFVVALELDSDEARFFRVLVRFNQATTPEERELAFDQLVALNRTPRTIMDPRHYQYYRHWWNGAVRAILAIHDLADEPRKLAALVSPPITEAQAKASLQLLSDLNLVARNRQGFWKPTDHTLSTGETARPELVRQLQIQQMGLVQSAILDAQRSPDQVVATNTISVSDAGLAMIRRRLERFRSELRSIVHKDAESPSRVHLVSMAIIPLSKNPPVSMPLAKAG
ncbi:MAG TPA: TIGR02147 family protein, partial [Fibrobacteria bacterium]|nr:TIGR02147 family protein [Fibrobacteria bacterium]